MTEDGDAAVRSQYAQICDLLERQSAVQSELLELSHEKRRVIIACDTEALAGISSKEMRLIYRGAAIERERTSLMSEMAKLLDMDASEITLSAMAERGEPDESARLRTLQRQLSQTLSTLRESNRLCGELLDTQLEYTDAMLGALAQGQDDDTLNNYYGMDGKAVASGNSRRGFFDGLA